MSADAFHSLVEKAMKVKKNLYDFNDFSECVSKNGVAVEMKAEDFFDFRNHLGTAKDTNYPYVSDVSVFLPGTKRIYNDVLEEQPCRHEYKCGEFATKKFRENVTNSSYNISKKIGPRGVNKSKVDDIIKKIGPIIPKERMTFWLQLPTNLESQDLTVNYDHLERTGKRRSDVLDTSGARNDSLRSTKK